MIVDIGGQLFPLNISAEVFGGLLKRFFLKGEMFLKNIPLFIITSQTLCVCFLFDSVPVLAFRTLSLKRAAISLTKMK